MKAKTGVLLTILITCSVVQAGIGRTSVAPSQGQGIELLRDCNAAVKLADNENVTAEETLKGFSCLSYLGGFADGFVLASSLRERNLKLSFCPPEAGAQNEQYARIVAKWLKEHPEELHESARMSVLIALNRAFPCK